MAINILIDTLRKDDKSGHLFDSNSKFVCYKTGFPTLDYYLGCMVNVFDDNGNVIEKYPALGITAGSINTFIGKSSVGKTTVVEQICANIVRPFPNGSVIHYDLERSSNYTRIGTVTKLSASEMKSGKYILRQINCSLEEIKMTISKIYREKTQNFEKYSYDTGKVDEFGDKITICEPTCILIDSVPSLSCYINENTKDGIKTLEEISTQTDKMRLTAEIGRFVTESMEMCKAANIIVFMINHIKTKPGMGVPQAPELPGLKQDETLPAGKALHYYTNMMLRLTLVGSEKYTIEEHGFDGTGISAMTIKNRSNINLTTIPLVFDKANGYDSLRSSIYYAKENGLLGGNRNGYYFINNKDKKFTMVNCHKEFAEDRELYKIMYAHIIPLLEKVLSSADLENREIPDEEMDY